MLVECAEIRSRERRVEQQCSDLMFISPKCCSEEATLFSIKSPAHVADRINAQRHPMQYPMSSLLDICNKPTRTKLAKSQNSNVVTNAPKQYPISCFRY
jgi:hypothetical protein